MFLFFGETIFGLCKFKFAIALQSDEADSEVGAT